MAWVGTLLLLGSEPCQPLFPETSVVGQSLLHCNYVRLGRNANVWEEMQQDSVKCATQALQIYNLDMDVVTRMKEFDMKYNPTWQCIVGKNFSSDVTHETTSSSSTWAWWPFFCSNLVKSMDCTAHPVIYPKIKTAA